MIARLKSHVRWQGSNIFYKIQTNSNKSMLKIIFELLFIISSVESYYNACDTLAPSSKYFFTSEMIFGKLLKYRHTFTYFVLTILSTSLNISTFN